MLSKIPTDPTPMASTSSARHESRHAFRTSDPTCREIIRLVLLTLPAPPRSRLRTPGVVDGGREGGGGGAGRGLGGCARASSGHDDSGRSGGRSGEAEKGGGGQVAVARISNATDLPDHRNSGGAGGLSGGGHGGGGGGESHGGCEVAAGDDPEEYDANREVALFGSVISQPWHGIWKDTPLILHDLQLIQSAASLDVSAQITNALKSHPGPTRYFRIDSSPALEENLIHSWCQLLVCKGVEEVMLVNTGWPDQIVSFQLNSIDGSSLRRLTLCFFELIDVCLCRFANLALLDLTNCIISDVDLFYLVASCKKLLSLDIGLRTGKVKIHSDTLTTIRLWWSSVPYFTIDNAPSLKNLVVGKERVPVMKKPSRIHGTPTEYATKIWIKNANNLQQVWFNLSRQNIHFDQISIHQGRPPLPNMRRLELTMSYAVRIQRNTLLNLLHSCQNLRQLILWREDDLSTQDVDDWLHHMNSLHCLKSSLEIVRLKDYQGGPVEVAFSSAILELGVCLKELTVDLKSNDSRLAERTRLIFENIQKASEGSISFGLMVHWRLEQ